MKINIDTDSAIVETEENGVVNKYPMDSSEAFKVVSNAWLRCGWDNKHVYSFTWMGRPIIQLPEDILRIQEVMYSVKPDILIETGVAHGGSLIFYASLFKAMDKGRVIGIDIEIRPHNREEIEKHPLFKYITLFEGSSIDNNIINQVQAEITNGETVMVVLDSNHSKDHVTKELEAYSNLVSVGSYIVATDGIMGSLSGAPRSEEDWAWNNPEEAAKLFVSNNENFVIEEPGFLFNESNIRTMVTYWPSAWIKRIK